MRRTIAMAWLLSLAAPPACMLEKVERSCLVQEDCPSGMVCQDGLCVISSGGGDALPLDDIPSLDDGSTHGRKDGLWLDMGQPDGPPLRWDRAPRWDRALQEDSLVWADDGPLTREDAVPSPWDWPGPGKDDVLLWEDRPGEAGDGPVAADLGPADGPSPREDALERQDRPSADIPLAKEDLMAVCNQPCDDYNPCTSNICVGVDCQYPPLEDGARPPGCDATCQACIGGTCRFDVSATCITGIDCSEIIAGLFNFGTAAECRTFASQAITGQCLGDGRCWWGLQEVEEQCPGEDSRGASCDNECILDESGMIAICQRGMVMDEAFYEAFWQACGNGVTTPDCQAEFCDNPSASNSERHQYRCNSGVCSSRRIEGCGDYLCQTTPDLTTFCPTRCSITQDCVSQAICLEDNTCCEPEVEPLRCPRP